MSEINNVVGFIRVGRTISHSGKEAFLLEYSRVGRAVARPYNTFSCVGTPNGVSDINNVVGFIRVGRTISHSGKEAFLLEYSRVGRAVARPYNTFSCVGTVRH